MKSRLLMYLNSKIMNDKNKIRGIVKQHMGRGTRLGFPTANIDIVEDVADGVYLALTEIEEKEYPSLAFSGKPKTFDDPNKIFEVYILDWEKDLYGHEIAVDLVKRIRPVTKFKNAQELILQMKQDELLARDFFKGYNIKHEQ